MGFHIILVSQSFPPFNPVKEILIFLVVKYFFLCDQVHFPPFFLAGSECVAF